MVGSAKVRAKSKSVAAVSKQGYRRRDGPSPRMTKIMMLKGAPGSLVLGMKPVDLTTHKVRSCDTTHMHDHLPTSQEHSLTDRGGRSPQVRDHAVLPHEGLPPLVRAALKLVALQRLDFQDVQFQPSPTMGVRHDHRLFHTDALWRESEKSHCPRIEGRVRGKQNTVALGPGLGCWRASVR